MKDKQILNTHAQVYKDGLGTLKKDSTKPRFHKLYSTGGKENVGPVQICGNFKVS